MKPPEPPAIPPPAESVPRSTTTRALAWMVFGFVAVWTLYATLSRLNLDGHGDMVENYAWGITWSAGYYKHPPLFAWIVAAWFTVFPNADWAYYLLSMTNAAVAIVAVYFLSRRYLDAERGYLAAVVLMLAPPYMFLAIKYNASSAMLPFWPLVTLCYLRMIERRTLGSSVLLGLVAAAAMLSKYYSALILLALLAHTLWDRDARALLKTAWPYAALAVMLAAMSPHLLWLARHDYLPMQYAADQGIDDWGKIIEKAFAFLVALPLYFILSFAMLLVVWWTARDRWAGYGPRFGKLWRSSEGRLLILVCLLPLLLTFGLGLAMKARVSSVWGLPIGFAWTILLLCLLPAGNVAIARRVATTFIVGMWIVMLAVSPLVRYGNAKAEKHTENAPLSLLAEQATDLWRQRYDRPVAYVGGDLFYANATSFYSPDHPIALQNNSFELTPSVSPDQIRRDGLLLVYRDRSDGPETLADTFPGAVLLEEITLPGKTFMGVEPREFRYRVLAVPPGEETR